MDCSLPGSSIRGIFQARVLEWVAIAFSHKMDLLNTVLGTRLASNCSFSCSILRNPVTNKKHYRLYVIYKVPQVRVLDFQKVKLKVSVTLL